MKVTVYEPKQYKRTYQSVVFNDVVKTIESKDGEYITLVFADGTKSRRSKRLVKSVEIVMIKQVRGEYNALEYRVLENDIEVYHAGNSQYDSQSYVPAEEGVGLEKMKEYCEQTTKEMAQEHDAKYAGIKKIRK